MDQEKKTSNFGEIANKEGLLAYLSNISKRLSDTKMVCQYTSLKAVIGIISKKYWYVGSPKNMNDGLELQQGLNMRDDIFFSSFMIERKESIAMWSMYAQPWEDGVMISIPKSIFNKWVRGIEKVYSADPVSKQTDENTFVNLDKARVFAIRVAYYTQGEDGKTESLSCGRPQNSMSDVLKSINDPSLVGYIKDDAWSYEREIRLRVELNKDIHYEGVAVEVPDYVIDSMIITRGPRFQGDLMERLKDVYNQEIKAESSLFYNKLNNVFCDKCTYKSKEKGIV